jgi:hypothetical protein
MFSGIGYVGSGLDFGVQDGGVYLRNVPTSWHGGWSEVSGFGVYLCPYVESTAQGVSVFLPLWIPVLACLLPWAIVWQRNRPPAPGRCGRCGYDLRGSTTSVCPECGLPFTNYRQTLVDLVEQLLDGTLTLSEFDDRFYSCYAERTPQWGLSGLDRAFFGTIHERLNWTGPKPDMASEPDRWMPESEFVRFVRQLYDRYMKGLCLKCGYDLTGNVSGTCPECGEAV